ncbi:MAG: hypothetical protein ACFE7E_09055, partial [Candidatus Hodarchaeota archaeon]
MSEKEQSDNPYDICTWKSVSECRNCSLKAELKCRFNSRDLLLFVIRFLLFLIPALAGFIMGGYGWYILGWIAFSIIFFGFWEIRILCSHCPFYAKRGSILHCIANYGCPKFWKFKPEPISKSEKIQLIAGFIIICGYPFPFLILGRQFILLFLATCGLGIFWGVTLKFTCSKCINFSC